MTRILAVSHQSIGLCGSQLHKALVIPIYIQPGLTQICNLVFALSTAMNKQNIYDIYKEKDASALFQNTIGPDWVSYPKVSLDSIDNEICWRMFNYSI